jgi:hypothetical protein
MVMEKVVEKVDKLHKVLEKAEVTADMSHKAVLEEREEREERVGMLNKAVLEEREEREEKAGMLNKAWEDMVVDMEVEGMAQDMVAEDWDKERNR